MPDYPPGYDPSQADYISARDQAIGGAIALGAFGGIALGAFFVVPAGTLGPGITINGTTYYGVSYSVAVALDAAGSGAIGVEASNAITSAAIMGSDAAAILAAARAYQEGRSAAAYGVALTAAIVSGAIASGGLPPEFTGFAASYWVL